MKRLAPLLLMVPVLLMVLGPSLEVAGLDPEAFVAVYVLAALAGLPISVLSLAAGPLYGVAAGIALVLVAGMVAAALAFQFSRRCGVTRAGKPGGLGVALSRLAPLPFGVTSYAWGLTQVPFRTYLLGTLAGLVPSTCLNVLGGAALRQGGPQALAGFSLLAALGLAGWLVPTHLRRSAALAP